MDWALHTGHANVTCAPSFPVVPTPEQTCSTLMGAWAKAWEFQAGQGAAFVVSATRQGKMLCGRAEAVCCLRFLHPSYHTRFTWGRAWRISGSPPLLSEKGFLHVLLLVYFNGARKTIFSEAHILSIPLFSFLSSKGRVCEGKLSLCDPEQKRRSGS